MLGLMITCALMIPLMSPIKVAFSVTTASILVSLSCYTICMAIFPSCGVVISFSSGMMILFCYCAMMTNYESKNYKNKIIVWAMITLIPTSMVLTESPQLGNTLKNVAQMNSSPFMLGVMSIIILAMMCINKSMFTPTKTLASSY